jgi:glycosyltransferase involved in cell wall biosynthesis
LNDVKGWDLAAEAVSRLAGAGRRVHLVIAGDGPRRPEVEAAARRRPGLITYLGRLPSGEIGALLDEVDVLALPSKSEGMPMVILEAMARGVPCVATRVAGIPECAEGCGLLLEERSADAVAAALARLADDAALRYALGRRAAEKHRQAFSFEAMAEHYMAIYRKLAEAEPAPPGLKELSCA